MVDTYNRGALPDLPDDAVVEVPARITATARRRCLRQLAPEMHGLVQRAAYEELAIEAAMSGDRDVALRALLANPLVGRYNIAQPLLDELLRINEPYLPQFTR